MAAFAPATLQATAMFSFSFRQLLLKACSIKGIFAALALFDELPEFSLSY